MSKSQESKQSQESQKSKIIFLCGFMGCGKSTVGELLAKEQGGIFIDIDKTIETVCGKTIPQIFAERGESHFRLIESTTIGIACGIIDNDNPKLPNVTIALGGGALTNPKNVEVIGESGTLVFIDVPFEVCYERIQSDGLERRPIAREKSREELQTLFNQRREIYLEHAQYTIDGNTNLNSLVERIMNNVNI